MKRILWIALIVAMVCLNFLPVNVVMAAGGNKQLIIGGYFDSQPSGSVANFNSLNGGFYWVAAANVAQVYQLVSTAGVIRDLYINSDTAAGNGKSYTFTVMVNGNPSDISVVLTGATQTQNSDLVHTATVAAGDYIALRCTPAGTPPNYATFTWASTFLGNTAKESLVLAQVYALKSATNYAPISSGSSFDLITTDLLAGQVIPTAGTLKNLYIKQDLDAGDAGTDAYTYTLYKNGVATALTCTVTADNTTANDVTHSVAVVAGDWVSMEILAVSTPAVTAQYTAMGMTFVATTAGQSMLLGGSTDVPTSSTTEYNAITPNRPSKIWQSTESNFYEITSSGFSLSNLRVRMSATPANPITILVRRAGTASTGMTVTITSPATTGTDAVNTYSTVDYEKINMAITCGASMTRYLYWSLVCTENPPPTVTTQAADNISYLSATLHGNITAIGGASPTIRGFQYGKTSGALDLDWHEHGTFIAETFSWATGNILDDDDTYYFRAYATNTIGTGYGAELTFDTLAYTAPTVQTNAAEDVSYTTATLHGEILGIDGDAADTVGYKWDYDGAPYDYDWHDDTGSFGVGTYDHAITGLNDGVTVYFIFYATNIAGTTEGAELNFNTLAYSAPTLDLLTIGTVTEATAEVNGNITSIDGDNATIRGVAYGEVSGAPDLDSHTHGSYGVGNYTVSLSGLDYGTLYYYKFYATNAGGTGYSAEGNFTTVLPLCFAPGNLTATQTGVGNITLTWDMGLYAEDTIIRISEDSCPGNITDGYLVYNGNETTATYSGLSLGMHEYCIRAWSSNDTGNSTGYAEVKIGGTDMGILALFAGMFFGLALMGFGYLSKSLAVMIGASMAWMGIAAYSYAQSAGWDIYRVMGALAMALIFVCLMVSIKQDNDKKAEAQKLIVKIEPPKSYGERFAEWEKKAGTRTKAEREANASARTEKNLSKRIKG